MAREAMVLVNEATKERFEFPVNPETIQVQHGRVFEEVPIINLASVFTADNLAPTTISWESFFPVRFDTYCNYRTIENPAKSVRRIEKWLGRGTTGQIKPTPLRTVCAGTYFSRLMVVTDFSTEFRGGEPGDVYYNISLQTWTQQQIRISAPSPTPPAAPARPTPPNAGRRTYTVKKGDSLWKIAQQIYGNGSKWPTIYEANRSIIGANPNLIRPGQVLVIP
jgi:hypothetical protein